MKERIYKQPRQKMTDIGSPHVTRVTLFRNGDPNFNGKNIVVNPRYYRNFDSFLDTATFSTQCTSAVTRIYTPLGRHTIESVRQFANGGAYVAVGRESFKRLKYGQPKTRKTPLRLPSVWRNQLPSSGRFRKIYEGERQALKRIYVYRNGDNMTPARMILLKRRTLSDMELVLAALQDSGMNFDFAISKIFTLNGKQIQACDEIVHNGKYVAIERGSRFKFMNYGGQGGASHKNNISNTTRLPPIASQHNTRANAFPQKQMAKANLNTPKPLAKHEKNESSNPPQPKRKQKEIKRSVVLTQQSVVSTLQDEKRESFSNISLSVTPPLLDESPDFTFSTATKAKECETNDEKLPDIGDIPRDIDELPEKEKESIGVQIYKASGMQREWGEMVTESRASRVKQINNVPVEEICEEITEDIEGIKEIAETPSENVKINNNMEKKSKTVLGKEEKVMEIAADVREIDEASERGHQKDIVVNIDKEKEKNDEERSYSKASKDEDDHSDEEAVQEDQDGISEGETESENGDNKNVDDDEEPDTDAVNSDNAQSNGESDEDGACEDEKASKDGDNNNVDGNENTDTDGIDSNDEQSDGEALEENEDEAPANDTATKDGDNKKINGDKNPNHDATGHDAVDASANNDDNDEENKFESPTASQNQTRRSSQEMNSEDEVKSEDEVTESEDNDDDDDEEDDDKSEENKDSEEDEKDKDEQSSVASESENEESEEEDETAREIATKENKSNQKFEKRRAQPDAAIKKDNPNVAKGKSTKTRDVNKA